MGFKDALGKYRTTKKCAEDMTKFARELTREQIVSQVMEFAHVRALPTYDTKNRLLERLTAVNEAAIEYRNAIKDDSGIEEARSKMTFDSA